MLVLGEMFSIETKKRWNVIIDTYDSKLEMTIFSKTKGRELLERVAESLHIKDFSFFGVAATKFDGKEVWLEDEKPVMQQRIRKSSEKTEFVFKFRFFPYSVEMVKEEAAILLL